MRPSGPAFGRPEDRLRTRWCAADPGSMADYKDDQRRSGENPVAPFAAAISAAVGGFTAILAVRS